MIKQDNIYAQPVDQITGFRFDKTVASVFDDMIQRSVPGYSSIIAMIGTLTEKYAQPNTTLYDLGCSLGGATLSMAAHIDAPNCQITAVDNAPAMLARCQENLNRQAPNLPIDLHCANIQDIEIENASVVVLNFTLQFIPLEDRLAMLQKIYRGMRSGGILILSEKIAFPDAHLNTLFIDLHHAFKKANGYSDLEISQKRSALENVLIPETLATHQSRIQTAGFQSCDIWFQCFNFASMVAIK